MKKFSWTDAINYGWNTTRSNLVFFIVLMLILGIVVVLPDKLVVLPTEPGALLKSSKFWVVTAISLLI
ncbi:MAG: hypothetical protein IH874_08475 [Candidatus Dadabacteria bacterium]|nr:hypothetical protein [Candidatus Dadabacteria bacterium]